ncbi:MAG: nucleoprotein/polynucleotide-associated enzyme [Massilia sp.]|nr:nucleoprotein/polynucleotide-associated enzyme [Massilia sp.]
MVSLHEQLLKAGLVDKNKVKQAAHKQHQQKNQQKKVERRTGTETVDEARAAALELQRKNAEKAREANAQRDAAAHQKAILAQIAQMLNNNRQAKGNGDIAYNFTHGSKIERIYVSAAVRDHLTAGRLVIVVLNGVVELVPRVIADKIAERDASLVVRVNKPSTQVDEDDPYAAFQIPDDLMW